MSIQRSYPESFFKDLSGKESTDTEFADYVLQFLLSEDDHTASETPLEQCETPPKQLKQLERRQYVYDILVEYYKENRSTSEIAEKHNAKPTTINQQRNWGLSRIRRILRGYTAPSSTSGSAAPSSTSGPSAPSETPQAYAMPVTFAEYEEQIRRKSELRKQYEQERQDLQEEELHGTLTPEDSIRRIDPLNLHIRVMNSLERYGIQTIAQFLSLTALTDDAGDTGDAGEEEIPNIPNIGKKGWEEIKDLQAEARERMK